MKRITILIYGFNDLEKETILSFLDDSLYNVNFTDNYNDIFADNYFTLIIADRFIDDDGFQQIKQFLYDVDGGTIEKIWITSQKYQLKKLLNFSMYNDINDLLPSLKKRLIKAQKRIDKNDNTAHNINNTILIYDYLKKHKNANTKKLALLINRNEGAVKRYLELIKLTDPNIIYNLEMKSWTYNK